MRLDGKPLSSETREILVASWLILWRAWALPWSLLWTDWFTLLCLFWIAAAIGSRTKAWPWITAGVMGLLLLLYGWRQVPIVLHSPGILP